MLRANFAHALPDPMKPLSAEALIRIRRVGVCGTDYHAFQGNQPFFSYPRILGHELGVEIVALGSGVPDLRIGDRCAVRPYLNCGRCPACQRGKPNCCPFLQVLGVHVDGGMREYAAVPTSHLHAAPALSFEQLALVEPLAIGAHAVARAQLDVGEHVLVVGVGPIGLAATEFALLAGAQVLVMDINEQRLAFCQQRWPEIMCLNAQVDPIKTLEELVGDDLPIAVFEATGNAESMRRSLSYVGYGGRVIFVGLSSGDVALHDPLFHSREVTLLASRNALADDFQRIIGALQSGRLDVGAWITHRTSLESVPDIFLSGVTPRVALSRA